MTIPNTVMFKNITVNDYTNYQIGNCRDCEEITITKLVRSNIRTGKQEEVYLCSDCLKYEVKQINKYKYVEN